MSNVNGQGLWRSWQRSFRRPVDALLDLVDNAVDANLKGGGQIHISTQPSPHNRQALLLLNSYASDVHKEISHILEVFSSNKDQSAVGENGVGLKQASANLSDFSIVLTKINNKNKFQMGILCRSLQSEKGINIPSYNLGCRESKSWDNEIEDLCSSDALFSDCVKYLGGKPANVQHNGVSAGDDGDRAELAEGRRRLVELIVLMSESDEWSSHDHVFGLLLDQIRDTRPNFSENLLNELGELLPSTYLHLSNTKIFIQQKPVSFHHWEQRLVELTCFPIQVSTSVDIWQEDETEGECEEKNVAQPLTDATKLRVYVGFDPSRTPTSTSLHIYSRGCGRLIKHLPDARNELSLSTGGTQYCQGLTVILDDYESTLPLTPTKQDITPTATHRRNIFAWLRAVAHTFWQFHFEKYLSKGALTDALDFAIKDEKHRKENFIPLAEFDSFTKFDGIEWSKRSVAGVERITTDLQNIEVAPGKATLIRMLATKEEDTGEDLKKKSKKSRPTRRPQEEEEEEEEAPPLRFKRTPTRSSRKKTIEEIPETPPPSSRKKKRASPKVYRPSMSVPKKRKTAPSPRKTTNSGAAEARNKHTAKMLKEVQKENKVLTTKLTKTESDCGRLRRDVRILERENGEMKRRLGDEL